jgi:two-component system nitrate/nitrite response regulator NarL
MGQVTAFPEAERIRVLAADSTSMSSQLLVEALSRDKRFEMLECVSTLADVVAVVQRSRAQIAVIGSRVADGSASGFELARELRSVSPSTRIIMLLDSSERSSVIEAFLAGARGVFSRTDSLKALAKCIHSVHSGQVWASSRELQFVLEALCEPAPMRLLNGKGTAMLSAREIDVVQSVAEGLTNREIAKRLGLTEHTVKNYLFRIFDKLGVSSRVEVVLYALGNVATARMPETGPTPPPRKEIDSPTPRLSSLRAN